MTAHPKTFGFAYRGKYPQPKYALGLKDFNNLVITICQSLSGTRHWCYKRQISFIVFKCSFHCGKQIYEQITKRYKCHMGDLYKVQSILAYEKGAT